jgi:CRP-like cAMP-binding protein
VEGAAARLILTTKDFRHRLEQSPNVERKVLRAIAKRVADWQEARGRLAS